MQILKRRWWIVTLCACAGLAGGLLGLAADGRLYRATSTLRVAVAGGGPDTSGQVNLSYTDRLINTYKQLAQTASLRADAERRLGGQRDITASVSPIANTELVDVNASAADRRLAVRGANAYAAALVDRINAANAQSDSGQLGALQARMDALNKELGDLRGQLATAVGPARATVAERVRTGEIAYGALAARAATLGDSGAPAAAVSLVQPATTGALARSAIVRDIALGLIAGLIAGAGLALLVERRSPQLDTITAVENASGSTVLGTVPFAPGGQPMVFNGASRHQDAFGALRARLLHSNGRERPRSVLITSAHRGEGRSVVAVNLAVSLARARRSVVLVDADLRHPSQHRLLDTANGPGLAELLEDDGPVDDVGGSVVYTSVPDLDLLRAGTVSMDAAELLASPRLGEVLDRLATDYEYVVVDSSELASGGDSTALAAKVDAVVVVVRRLPASDDELREARRRLEGVGAVPFGVIVNRCSPERPRNGALV